jgi:glycosyltransferase involved in cell wall biosynthesis
VCDHARVRVALDATPLLGKRTGIGQYVAHLAHALAARTDVDVVLTAFSWRGRLRDTPDIPPGADIRSRRAPARLLRAAWTRSDLPPVELLSGRVDVFHGTNFVLPPTRHAAGVVTVHDVAFLLHADTVDATSRAYRTLVPRALSRARAVLTPSAAAADDLAAAYGLDRDRVVVTPLGVDPAWATTPTPSAGWLAERGIPARYVLFVGTLEPRKNLPDLLAAHRRLRSEQPDTPPLVLAGAKGWGEAVNIDPDNVVWPGYLPQDELRSLTAGAAVLVMPSRYEGFGLPALEALACGVPVVASDIPVLREVTGGLARYAPVGDVDALADQLQLTLTDGAGGAGEPAAAGARRAWAAAFTWERCAATTAEAYHRAAANS